jgi:PhnB protein
MADSTYRTVTPYLLVTDADALIKFITAVFGATEKMIQRHPDGSVGHGEMTIGDSLVMVAQAGGPWKPRTAAFYVWIDDVDAVYQRALRAGATSESAPEDKPYGHRNAGVEMCGITWWLAAPIKPR